METSAKQTNKQCSVVCCCLCWGAECRLKQLKVILVFVCCPGWNNDPLILLPLHLHCPVKLNKKISWPIHPTAKVANKCIGLVRLPSNKVAPELRPYISLHLTETSVWPFNGSIPHSTHLLLWIWIWFWAAWQSRRGQSHRPGFP